MKDKIQIVKIGASVAIQKGRINYSGLDKIAYDVKRFLDEGINSPMVISGSIRFGMSELGYKEQPGDNDVKALQMCACVGQPIMTEVYRAALKKYGIKASQLLITYHNLANPEEERNIEERVNHDVENGIVTLINYNDGIDIRGIAIYDDEGKLNIRDNDMVSANMACYLDAFRLVMLTNPLEKGTTGGGETKQAAINLVSSKGIDIIIGDYRKGLYDLVNDVK
jgi:glutamate 5-kinase|tara:strand:- start:3249 stop:3920 length:672 start_codon:yes stop_codon:yes gene_type:complete